MFLHHKMIVAMRVMVCAALMLFCPWFCWVGNAFGQENVPSNESTTYCYDFEADGFYFRVLNDQCVALTAERITHDKSGGRTYHNTFAQRQLSVPATVLHADTLYKVVMIDQGAFVGAPLLAIELPASVLSIGTEAFAGCYQLAKLVLPEHLQAIGDSAFAGCSSLANILLPKSVEYIGHYAFAGCTNLQKIRIEKGNQHFVVKGCALYDVSERLLLSSPAAKGNVTVPSGVEKISEGAFAGCTTLQSVMLPQTLKEIGAGAFSNSGLKSISLPRGLKTIQPYTFANTHLSSVVLPYGLTAIEQSAFEGCRIGSVSLPNTLVRIGENAFKASFLKSVGFPDALCDIGKGAFESCPLYSISFGKGLISVGPRAFFGAPVVQMELPAKLKYIGADAFAGCSRLLDIYSLAPNPPMIEQEKFASHAYFGVDEGYDISLHVPAASAEAYRIATGWKNFSVVLQIQR